MDEAIYVGISFGTVSASIAILGNESRAEVIANEDGERITPCYVAFTDHEELAGFQAKVQAMSNPKNTIFQFRSLLGLSYEDDQVTQHSQKFPFQIVPHPNIPSSPAYEIETKPLSDNEDDEEEKEPILQHFTVSEITTKFLTKLKSTAEGYIGKPVQGCVISVPVHFAPNSKKDLINAAQKSGFVDVFTVDEPVAAALAFDQKINATLPSKTESPNGVPAIEKKDKMILVLDLGAHQLNATILRSSDGLYSIIATADNFELGGAQFDEVLVKFCVSEFKRKHKMDISESRRSMIKLRAGCENTKKTLSRTDVAPCSIESLYEGMDFSTTINRGRFEMLAEPLFAKCKEVINSVLSQAQLMPSEVDEVLLVGGSTRIPRFQTVVKSMFSHNNTIVSTDVVPDEAISLGCAIQAGIILSSPNIDYAAAVEDEKLLHSRFVTKSIGIETADGQFAVLIPQRTPIPVKRTVEFSNAIDNQKEYFVAVYEGESQTAKENELMAEIVVGDLPLVKAGTAKLHISFIIENDGILNVTAAEATSNRTMRVKIDHISK
ncbi:70-kilodalton heat shock protein [Nowakowskiella sp. JEL0407]|nr:70-kilodalton heat shock protein [Nowakowskiella sp. JEL0407]